MPATRHLDPPQQQQLVEIMIDYFGEENEFNEVLKGMNAGNLRRYVKEAGLEEQYALLVEQFNRKGQIEDLCNGIVNRRPDIRIDVEQATGMQLTLAGRTPFNPFEFLDQFDRYDERDLVGAALYQYIVPPPIKPIVVGILAERDDEYTYLISTLNADVLRSLYQEASWALERLNWSSVATAEFEIRKIATKKLGDGKSDIATLLKGLGPALSGRSFCIELRSESLQDETMVAKLSEFLTLWAMVGELAPPPVLYIAAVRYSDDAIGPDLAKAPLEMALAPLADQLTIVKPFTLSLCDASHFDQWRDALTSLGKKIDSLAFDRFKRSINKARFRFREIMEQLERADPFY